MQRSLIQHFLGSGLHNEAQVHNGDTVRDHLHNGKVMGDKYVCQLVLLLELMEKVLYLCLDGNVQSGDRLVGNHQMGVYRKGTGNSDPLLLSTGELMRITAGMLIAQTNDL